MELFHNNIILNVFLRDLLVRKDDKALYDVAQLADVPCPVIVLQRLYSVSINLFRRLFVFLTDLLQEMV